MSRASIPPLDPADLRDHADTERVERIWERLSGSLAHDAHTREPSRSHRGLWLAAAASLVLVFGTGVLVGRSLTPTEPFPQAALRPTREHVEPRAAAASEASLPASGQPGAGLVEQPASASPEQPAGSGRSAEIAHSATPIAAVPARSAHARTERPGEPTTEPPSAGPPWLARYNSGSYADARDLLAREPGGMRGAIASARDAFQLTALAEIAWSGGDQPSAVAALTRVATDFQGGQYAQIAAYKLGKFYESQGQSALAGSYAALARSLSANGNLDEDALCIQIRSAKERAEALQMAEDYLAKYPHGRCKDDAERVIANEPDDVADDAPIEASPGAAAGAASVGAALTP
jgi:hypothetical protein